MTRYPARRIALNSEVFVNCPFDDAYRPCFEAILFTLTLSGYEARTALEDDDAGDVRFDKLCELIAACDRSIHDLSRTAAGTDGLPRFNMPFELGLMMGARRYGSPRQRAKRAMIMVAEPFAMPRFLSDLAGNDPKAHQNDPEKVIAVVRDHLHTNPEGRALPGPAHMASLLGEFHRDLPALARNVRLTMAEIDPYRGYRNFMDILHGFCATVSNAARAR